MTDRLTALVRTDDGPYFELAHTPQTPTSFGETTVNIAQNTVMDFSLYPSSPIFAFALSTDFFNSNHPDHWGAVILMDLPQSIPYEADNLSLTGITPDHNESVYAQFNQYTTPMVDACLRVQKEGFHNW